MCAWSVARILSSLLYRFNKSLSNTNNDDWSLMIITFVVVVVVVDFDEEVVVVVVVVNDAWWTWCIKMIIIMIMIIMLMNNFLLIIIIFNWNIFCFVLFLNFHLRKKWHFFLFHITTDILITHTHEKINVSRNVF